MVETSSEICNPLDEVYGKTTFEIIKETMSISKEEIQRAGLKFFRNMTPS